MKRNDYPDAAFAYIDGDSKLFLHHSAEARSGDEHTTVDPLLLMLALELVDVVPMSDQDREATRRHLKMHANVVLWEDEDAGGMPIALQDKMRDFAFFKANMDGVGTVPPVTTEARGTAYCMYAKRTREFSWFIEFEGLSSAQAPSHFHRGKAGKLGDIAIPIDAGSPVSGSTILTKELEEDLFQGNVYLNIHSANYPVGEIRGQVIPTALFTSNNSTGGREAPNTTGEPRAPRIDPMGTAKELSGRGMPMPMKGQDENKDENGKSKKNGKKEEKKSGPTHAKQVKPPKENPTNNSDAIYEPLQKEPDSAGTTDGGPGQITAPKEGKPGALTPRIDKQGDKGAVFSQELSRKPSKPPTLPAGTEVRPGITETLKVPGDDSFDDGQLQAPDDPDPNADDIRTVHPAGDKGAVYSSIFSDDDKALASRTDFAQPAVNVDTSREAEPRSDERRQAIMENGNSTGVGRPPKAAPSAVSVSEASEEDLSSDPNTGRRSRGGVVHFATDESIDGRRIILSSEKKVITVAASKSDQLDQLPDSAFAVIERGGKKDESGRTTPRSLRHLPHHAAESDSLGLPQLRNALSRMNQIKAGGKDNTDRIRRVARAHLIKHAKEVLPNSEFARSSGKIKLRDIIAEVDVAICEALVDGSIQVVEAQLMDVIEESSVKLFRVVMGEKDSPFNFFVRVRMDGSKNATSVEFDFDTFLPARLIPDFTKFLRQLPVEKKE